MNKIALAPLAALTLAGCATELPKNMPLVFGESITVGIGVGATTADQGMDFTLGFKSRDVAIIPVVAYDQAGAPQRLNAENREDSKSDKSTQSDGKTTVDTARPERSTESKDAFSVLGVFSTDTSATTKTTGIGKFFATGTAAQRIADGFSQCLASGGCDGKSAASK
jgi:hypothetical protein